MTIIKSDLQQERDRRLADRLDQQAADIIGQANFDAGELRRRAKTLREGTTEKVG